MPSVSGSLFVGDSFFNEFNIFNVCWLQREKERYSQAGLGESLLSLRRYRGWMDL